MQTKTKPALDFGVFAGHSDDNHYNSPDLKSAESSRTTAENDLRAQLASAEAREVVLKQKVEAAEARELAAFRSSAAKDAAIEKLKEELELGKGRRGTVVEFNSLKRSLDAKTAELRQLTSDIVESDRKARHTEEKYEKLLTKTQTLEKTIEEKEKELLSNRSKLEFVRRDATKNLKDVFYAEGSSGLTPLHCASIDGSVERVTLLLSKFADTNARDKWGKTPLMIACNKGGLEVVRLLVDGGADVNASDYLGKTALHWAMSVAMIRILMTKGSSVNTKDSTGNTALHDACRRGSIEIAKYLVSKGANITIRNLKGQTPGEVAKSHNHSSVVRFLEEQ